MEEFNLVLGCGDLIPLYLLILLVTFIINLTNFVKSLIFNDGGV